MNHNLSIAFFLVTETTGTTQIIIAVTALVIAASQLVNRSKGGK